MIVPTKKRSTKKKVTKSKSTKKKLPPKSDIKPLTEFTENAKKSKSKETAIKKEKSEIEKSKEHNEEKIAENKVSAEKKLESNVKTENTDTEKIIMKTLTEAPKLKKDLIEKIGDIKETEKIINLLSKEERIKVTKISRYNVYYLPHRDNSKIRKDSENTGTIDIKLSKELKEQQAKSAQILLEIKNKDRMINEYQKEITNLNTEIRQFKASEAYDTENMWEHIAWEMASVLAEQKGITVDEAIQYFKKKTGLI